MMAQIVDRRQLKAEMKEMLRTAQVAPKAMIALYMLILLAMNLADAAASLNLADGAGSIMSTFVSILVSLMSTVLFAGFAQYCMAIRRSERVECLSLFDGFSFAGKLIALDIVSTALIGLWSMLFVIPGIIASYRYRFAVYNLCENPNLSILEALNMSKEQTRGYKAQLFMLDLSYVGWTFLATVPATFFSLYASYQTAASMFHFSGPALSMGVPLLAQILVAGLWDLVVSLFYLAVFQSTDLGFFEIAKSTSGVGAGYRSAAWDGDGPDNMGGL